MKKYKITEESHPFRPNLHRIIALKSFGNIKKDELGGWIEKEANLSQYDNCWVYSGSMVYDSAKILNKACVYSYAKVFDNAIVSNRAEIHSNAMVYGNAKVYGHANVCGYARIYDNAKIYGEASVCGADVNMNAEIMGSSRISGQIAVSKTPLQIQGSRHFVNINGEQLQIGCKLYHIEHWKEHFEEIGKYEMYTDEEIKEYKKYIYIADEAIKQLK